MFKTRHCHIVFITDFGSDHDKRVYVRGKINFIFSFILCVIYIVPNNEATLEAIQQLLGMQRFRTPRVLETNHFFSHVSKDEHQLVRC